MARSVVRATLSVPSSSSSTLLVVVSRLSWSLECSASTSGGRGWNISEKDCGVGLARWGGRGVVKGLGSGSGNLTDFWPLLDLGVTLRALSRAKSRDFPRLKVSKISLNVDLSTRRPNPAGVVGTEMWRHLVKYQTLCLNIFIYLRHHNAKHEASSREEGGANISKSSW